MERICEIVRDLLPLYLEGQCSEGSRKCVEEHLAECESCGSLMEELRGESRTEAVPEGVSIPDEEAVFRRTARWISGRVVRRVMGVSAIVLYWMVYFWMNALTEQGNYQYFSYSVWELYSFGYLLVPLLAAAWLAMAFAGAIKRKNWRRNAALMMILALLLCLQAGYIHWRSQMIVWTTWTEEVAIPDEYHVIIESGEHTVELETLPNVTRLLKMDGTVYGFWYECHESAPEEGRLKGIWGYHEKTE